MKRILRAWREHGTLHAARVLANRIVDFLADRHLGIRGAGLIPIETLIPIWTDCHDYFPTSFSTFKAVLAEVGVRGREDVFVDYGSGKGRVLLMAATHPFRRVIGVEISPQLCEAARENVRRFRGSTRSPIEIWTGSAADFPLPSDASIVYLYNPFHGEVLRRVLSNLRVSLDEHPRRLTLIFNNPIHFMRIAPEYPWLIERRSFSFEHLCVIFDAR